LEGFQLRMPKFKSYILFLVFNTVFAICSFGSSPSQDIDEVVQGLKSSMDARNARNFSEFLDNTVDMIYSNTHSTYTRGHAIIILNDFYNKNHPKSFKVDFKGTSPNSDAQYIIGTANTDNGPFRVYLYIKTKNGKAVVQEMKIAQ
jgi:hypothetical protein